MPQATAMAYWALAAVAAPFAYMLYTKKTYDRKTIVTFNIASSALAVENILCDGTIRAEKGMDCGSGPLLAPEVLNEPGAWVVAKEIVVSEPVATGDLDASLVRIEDERKQTNFQGLVNLCLRTNMQLFAWTPQAWFIHRLIKVPGAKKTFSTNYLGDCRFEVGDRVCGVYVVTSRVTLDIKGGHVEKGGELVVLNLAPPEGWTGPAVQGRLVVGCERIEQEIRIFSQVLLWRRKSEKPVFLEGVVGRWMHAFMVQWFVVSSVQALKKKL